MQTELTTDVTQSMSDVGQWLAVNQSRLVAAAILLALGIVLAFLLRALTVRIVNTVTRAFPGRAFHTDLAGVVRERPVANVVAAVVFWAVLLFFIATAADALGIELLSAVVTSLSLFVPRVFAAVLILIAGLVLGNLARSAVSATASGAGRTFSLGVGQIARFAIVTAAVLIAIGELGVDIAILTAIFSVSLAALLGGFALAFGLGARTAISNIIGSHYVRQSYEIGQRVRIGGIEGTIAELTATAVVLDSVDGRINVPASQFGELPSMLLVKGDAP